MDKPIFDKTIKYLEENINKNFKISLVSIDSKNRNKLLYPHPNNFIINLNNTYTNIKQIKLKQIQIENMFPPVYFHNNKIRWMYLSQYNYNKLKCKNTYPTGFTDNEEYIVSIKPGNYTVKTLINSIRNAMNKTPHILNYPLNIDVTLEFINSKTAIINKINIKPCVHNFSIYINPITNKSIFINRLENLKIYCIQTIMKPEDDKLGFFFGQTFLKGDKSLDSLVNSDNCVKSIYIYIRQTELYELLSFNYSSSTNKDEIIDSIWDDKNNYDKLKQFFKSIPFIPSNIPSIGGIDKDLINNKEYYLIPPMETDAYINNLDMFTPYSNYQGSIIQAIDIIRMGIISISNSAIKFNSDNTIGNIPSNLLRLRLEIKDNNKAIYPKFNQTYFLDESTSNFYLNYNLNKVSNLNLINTSKYEFQLPTITGPILNHSLLEENENDELPIIGRGIPFKFVLDSPDDLNIDGTTNSLLLFMGWYKSCKENIVVSNKCPIRAIHTNLDFNIYNKINYYTQNINYIPPQFPNVRFLYQNVGNNTFIISSQNYVYLRILFPNNKNYDSLIIAGDNNNITSYSVIENNTKYNNSIIAKIMLSNIPGNISNFEKDNDINNIVINNVLFDEILLEDINKIRIQILNENGRIINIVKDFNLTIELIEIPISLHNTNINSKTNQEIILKHYK